MIEGRETLPATTRFGDLSGGAPVIVLAPHPDDESLGCGALLAHAFSGSGGHVVCMTDGAASHPGSAAWPPARLAARRRAELDAAVAALGGGPCDITRLGLPDAAMPRLSEIEIDRITARIIALARRLGARTLVTTAPTDPHCDHVVTARIGAGAARHAGLRCLFYKIWSRWPDRGPADHPRDWQEHRLDASPMRDRKARAVAAHKSQLGGLIDDDPAGFVLPGAFIAKFVETDEVFYEGTAA